MELKDKKCVPCHSYVPPLSLEEKKNLLKSLSSDWALKENDSRLCREYKFKNWKRAIEFANVIGNIAELEKHHPELMMGWGHCDVMIWTHTNNNLMENDFVLAAKIEDAFLKLYPKDGA